MFLVLGGTRIQLDQINFSFSLNKSSFSILKIMLQISRFYIYMCACVCVCVCVCEILISFHSFHLTNLDYWNGDLKLVWFFIKNYFHLEWSKMFLTIIKTSFQFLIHAFIGLKKYYYISLCHRMRSPARYLDYLDWRKK